MILLAWLMYLDATDALHLAVLLLYSAAAGGGAAFALSRGTTVAVDRLAGTAHRLGDGDLDARVGPIDDDPELGELARTLDDMAARLQGSIERERALEAHRLDMITAASHDLRTPLASLRAMIEAIEDGVVPAGAERDRYMAEMRKSVESLTVLTDDLFDLIKLDAGAIEADPSAPQRIVTVRGAGYRFEP
jgi:signal transduction histidine kinase